MKTSARVSLFLLCWRVGTAASIITRCRWMDPLSRSPASSACALTAVPLTGKAPPYSPHRHDPHVGDNVGLFIEDPEEGSALFYAPGLGGVDARLLDIMKKSDCLMVDGTFWQEDEMIVTGVGTKLAAQMGHLPQSGEGGMIEVLRPLTRQRKILIHINNTNPILVEDSPERRQLESEGIEVAYDGMEIRPQAARSRHASSLNTHHGDDSIRVDRP